MSRFFVTTPIFYVNAAPHIGHCHSLVLADAFHRLYKLRNPGSDTIFATGTDEHGLKIQRSAAAAQISEKKFCDQVSSQFQNLCQSFKSTHTTFIRTTEEHHKVAVQKFWETLSSRDHITKREYEGWYSTSDETFVKDVKELEINGSKITVDAETEKPLEWTKEENYVFLLSKFKGDLLHWLDTTPSAVQPRKFQGILRHSIETYLEDLSVSRCSERVKWAIRVPNDPSQSIYVWLDALVNYLTVAGYPDLKMWPPDVQVIGKDILTFHGIYWPAFLMAAGLEPPRSLFCHSHWTVEGKKMSKSVGNIVDPFELAETVQSDGLRYFLLRHATPHSDASFNEAQLYFILNNDLADTYGNLLSRCTGKVVNKNQSVPRLPDENSILKKEAQQILEKALNLSDKVHASYNEGNFYLGIDMIQEVLRDCNGFVERAKPWLLAKGTDEAALNTVLHTALEIVRITSILLQPVIPDITNRVLTKLNATDRSWQHASIHRNSEDVSLGPAKTQAFPRLKIN